MSRAHLTWVTCRGGEEGHALQQRVDVRSVSQGTLGGTRVLGGLTAMMGTPKDAC